MSVQALRGAVPDASVGSVGMWTFLVSDVFSFFALLVAYAVLRTQAPIWPAGTEPALVIPAALGLTAVLFLSSVTFAFGVRAARNGNTRRGAVGMLVTALLGVLFLVGQAIEYRLLWTKGLTLQSGLAGASFYAITLFHGLHVLAGLPLLVASAVALLRGKTEDAALEVRGLYWHFVDGMWTAIVASVYLVSWPGLVLAALGVGAFFVTQLRSTPRRFKLTVLLPLAMPALYTLGLLFEAWTRAPMPGLPA